MSVENLLIPTPPAKAWANLYVNSISSDSEISSVQSLIIAKNTSAQSVTSGSGTNATFNSLSTVGSAISYSTGVFTASKAGKYLVTFSIDFPAYTASGPAAAFIAVTSSSPSQGNRATSQIGSTQAYAFYLAGSEVLKLNQGDTFSIKLLQTSGGNLNLNGAGIVSIYQLP